eukprot:9395213-Pyramimonas_sp.AAC.1
MSGVIFRHLLCSGAVRFGMCLVLASSEVDAEVSGCVSSRATHAAGRARCQHHHLAARRHHIQLAHSER